MGKDGSSCTYSTTIKLAMAGTYNGGADFLHSWFIDSIIFIRSKNIVALSDSFHGGLARAFANLTAVLRVNNSLSVVLLYFLLPHNSLS